jgi:hypothetical protein
VPPAPRRTPRASASRSLSELIADEIVTRRRTGKVPAPVIYSLTEYGEQWYRSSRASERGVTSTQRDARHPLTASRVWKAERYALMVDSECGCGMSCDNGSSLLSAASMAAA